MIELTELYTPSQRTQPTHRALLINPSHVVSVRETTVYDQYIQEPVYCIKLVTGDAHFVLHPANMDDGITGVERALRRAA